LLSGHLLLSPFFFLLITRFEAFGSYYSRRNYELGKKRSFVSDSLVSKFMQFYSVPEFGFPTDFANIIVSELILFKRFKEYFLLFFRRFENEFNGSLHFYIQILLQYLQNIKCGLLPSLTEGVSDRKEGEDKLENYFVHFFPYKIIFR